MKLFVLFVFISTLGYAREASLYNGEEKRFQQQDRNRVLNVLQNMGIPYRVAPDSRILVNQKILEEAKDIVAQGFQYQRRVQPAASTED